MIALDILKRFCSDETARLVLTEPFSWEQYTYATDGKLCIRVPRMAEVTTESNIITVLPWDIDEISGWQDMPQGYQVPPRKWCPSCMGFKKIQPCLDCEFRMDCEDPENCGELMTLGEPCTWCGIDGKVYLEIYFRVKMRECETELNGEYLELLRILPGTIWLAPDPKDPNHACVRIRSSAGWDGMLMPMKPKKEMQ